MTRYRTWTVVIILATLLLGWFILATEPNKDSSRGRFSFKLGLDLRGGSQLTYRADVSGVPGAEIGDAMAGLRDVIERRVNLFGVSEPVVQVEKTGIFAEEVSENRLIVELPGVTDLDQAIKLIGETPLLEFKLVKEVKGTTTPSVV